MDHCFFLDTIPWNNSFTDLMTDQAIRLFEAALPLVYEDGFRKDITFEALDAVDKAIVAGSIDAPILKGIQLFGFREDCLQYFQHALDRGSTHPLLYYYLGLHSYRETNSCGLAFPYFERALGGRYKFIVSYIHSQS